MSRAAVAACLERAWGQLETLDRDDGRDIVRAGPSGSRGWYSVATVGVFERPLALPAELAGRVPERVELVTYSADAEPWPSWLLSELADLPAGEAVLTPYRAVALSAPVVENSELAAALLLPPWFETDETAALAGQGTLLWALPITRAELSFAVVGGGRALEEVLVASDIAPYPDLQRASLV